MHLVPRHMTVSRCRHGRGDFSTLRLAQWCENSPANLRGGILLRGRPASGRGFVAGLCIRVKVRSPGVQPAGRLYPQLRTWPCTAQTEALCQ